MDTIIKNILNKDREAFEELNNSIKNRVYFLSWALTGGDMNAAASITKKAITEAFQSILENKISTQDDFERFAINNTLDLSKAALLKKAPNAFDILEEGDEKLTAINEKAIDPNASGAANYIKALPIQSVWEIVLRLFEDMSDKDICNVLSFSEEYLDLLKKSQYESLESVYRLTTRKGGHCPAPTKELIKAAFESEAENMVLPQDAEDRINEYIVERSDPPKKKLNIKKYLPIAIPVLIVLIIAAVFIFKPKANDQSSADSTDVLNIEEIRAKGAVYINENPEELDPEVVYFADIDIADHGMITIMFYPEYAPVTVANFIKLATDDFYDGLTFHRIMNGFMMQGGDPKGNGTGGSDENIVGEFVDNGHPNYISHARGAVSMARASDYNSASSQFFIVHEDSAFLDGQYAAFAYVVNGIDIVDTICTSARPTDGNGSIAKDEQPVMNDIAIWCIDYDALISE